MKKTMGMIMALVMGLTFAAFADAVTEASERVKARRATIAELVKNGAAEEGADGYLVAKKTDKDTTDLVTAENRDRKIGYEAIAKKNNTTAEAVGKARGEANRKKAAEQ